MGHGDIMVNGQLGQNNRTKYSSPVQVGSDTYWRNFHGMLNADMATKTDGTLWMWGSNPMDNLDKIDRVEYSSPVQIPGTSWTI